MVFSGAAIICFNGGDEGRKLALERQPQFGKALSEPPHYFSDQVRDRSWGFLTCRKAAEGRIGCISHSTVENRDGAADFEHIDLVEIVFMGQLPISPSI